MNYLFITWSYMQRKSREPIGLSSVSVQGPVVYGDTDGAWEDLGAKERGTQSQAGMRDSRLGFLS